MAIIIPKMDVPDFEIYEGKVVHKRGPVRKCIDRCKHVINAHPKLFGFIGGVLTTVVTGLVLGYTNEPVVIYEPKCGARPIEDSSTTETS